MDPVKNVGIEDLRITRASSDGSGGGFNVYFLLAANCWVKGCEVSYASSRNINIQSSTHITIKGNYIHHSRSYNGSNGNGYGVSLYFRSTNCLIEDNLLYHLRHHLLVCTSVNRNVISYNYTWEREFSELSGNLIGDISLHGNYPHRNLFEGNSVENIFADDWHGYKRGVSSTLLTNNGPYNTFLRNSPRDEEISLYACTKTNVIGCSAIVDDDPLFIPTQLSFDGSISTHEVYTEFVESCKNRTLIKFSFWYFHQNIRHYLPEISYYLTKNKMKELFSTTSFPKYDGAVYGPTYGWLKESNCTADWYIPRVSPAEYRKGFSKKTLNGGIIESNSKHIIYWSGSKVIQNNFTVTSNEILTISPDAIIKFKNNAKLVVNGTLNVHGTTTNRVTFDFITKNNNGIYCYQGSNVNINNAIIKNAWYGIHSSHTNPIIKNTLITDNHFGISADYSNPLIENCEIIKSVFGIHLHKGNYGQGTTTVINSRISFNNSNHSHGEGIFSYQSNIKIFGTEVTGYSYGISSSMNSSSYLGNYNHEGRNKVFDNWIGIHSSIGSYMFLGRESCELQGGNNSVYNNSYKNAWAAHQGSSVQAENTWWGSSIPNTNKFYVGEGCYIDYEPYLSSNPLSKVFVDNKSPEEILFNRTMDKSSPKIDSKIYHYNKKWSLDWKIYYLRNLVMVKDYDFVKQKCKNIIEIYPDSIQSLRALNLYFEASRNNNLQDFEKFLQIQIKKKKVGDLYFMIDILLEDMKNAQSKNVNKYNSLQEKYKNKKMQEVLLFHRFNYNLFELNDKKEAAVVAKELREKYFNSHLTRIAFSLLGKPLENNIIDKPRGDVTKLNYKLLGNYPNPFNPSKK